MGKYSKHFLFPDRRLIKKEAMNGRQWRDYNVSDILGMLHHCRICGKQDRCISNYIKLTPIFDSRINKIVYECQYHGGENGKILYDCVSGEMVDISPEPSKTTRKFIEIYQEFIYRIIVSYRFIKLYAIQVFFWLITRIDITANIYRKIFRYE